MYDIVEGVNVIILIIGLLSILSLGLFLDRFLSIRRLERENRAFFKGLVKHKVVELGDIMAEGSNREGVVVEGNKVLGIEVLEGLLGLEGESQKGDRRRLEYIEESIGSKMLEAEGRVSYIGTIASIAPLLGLLGTVLGMIDSLQVMEYEIRAGEGEYTEGLLNGIWTALSTTAAGLIVAIPSLAAYNYLMDKLNKFGVYVKLEIIKVIDRVKLV